MMAAGQITGLIDRLSPVQGDYVENASLADVTWFRVGGTAEIMFRPLDEADLIHFLKHRPRDVPILVIGVGSNVLIRDGGIPGVVIRLGRGFGEIEIHETEVRVGAGAPDVGVALACAASGVGGLEFLRGVPGTIGGALRMNAGAYGSEIADVLVRATAVGPDGEVHVLEASDMGLSYRHCAVPEDWIFTRAVLRGVAGERNEIQSRMKDISDNRLDSQPVRTRTGGSTFKNPAPDVADGAKAWELIEAAGCRGLRRGGAEVSRQHCNFLINTGDATAADLEGLGEEVRRRVREKTGVELEWEIRILGQAAETEPRLRTANGKAPS